MRSLYIFSGITGIVMLICGLALNYWINRRRFNRRTIAGMQVFRNYEHAWSTRLFERIGKLIAFGLIVGGIMMGVGAIMMHNRLG